ncbi:aminotransferase-like domain-containing protein [Microterricola viridarii]|uniref:DNA-binding transcriptional regulator, MocR family, contains an aminotransferase domain n=1 Tax=Microterricola viridarii TaxID=412690 RepID=A0A1H1NA27_9MICO|nr:aminotransferase class I/II-fold pyridoxal phosphate-dependent enzyme [Microterricola viridarii]SDR95710.1 DNA-binding transcriptional regulator, MocR family, contains an aminotransferase domain [Microterricola viridarii]
MNEFWNEIDDATPRGIAAAIARRITSGELRPGDRLPTVRALGTLLGVSPATVSHAWQALSQAGLIESRGRAGSFVRQHPQTWLPPRMLGLVAGGELPQDATHLDLSHGTPDPLLLPALGPALSRVSLRAETSSYHELPVVPELGRVLDESWPYRAESLTVVDGAQDAVSRSLESVVRFGDRVVLESPGFPAFFDLVSALGASVVPVAIDEHGILPSSLAVALRQGPSALVLQPRAQNPTGASMTAERAQELARVIRSARNGSQLIVVEDDHSGQISTAAPVSLGRWIPDQVLHVRSFSKSHGPDLRIAALGGPAALIDRIVSRRMLGPGWTSRMVQRILADLLTDGTALDEVTEARRQYYSRQKALNAELAQVGVHAVSGVGEASTTLPDGINLWLPVADERAALVQLAAAGIRVAPGSPFLAGGAVHTDAAIGGVSSVPGVGPGFVRVTAGMVRSNAAEVAGALAGAALPGPRAFYTLEA